MKVYLENAVHQTLMVTPGAQHTDVSDWKDAKGNAIRYDIKFVNGVASVDDKMGKYLIDMALANRTALKRVTNRLMGAFA